MDEADWIILVLVAVIILGQVVQLIVSTAQMNRLQDAHRALIELALILQRKGKKDGQDV